MRRNRKVTAAIRVGLVALPMAVAALFAGTALAEPDRVQPGVTSPAPPEDEEPAELRAATPQNAAPAPRPRPATPDKTETPAPPPPRSVRIGEFSAPVPEGVPDEVVQGIQNAIDPNAPQPKP
ncbi:hypothetical protein [Nocardia transvalensis]|uniref:hypothetical protein n=1 Tax=Nocardia transvalensis TaxID=37333 RepID=UPI001894BF28|nr:hypothetical protein [Nocardia transvalensis]MBF6329079.1 hypothetical protein [Nocardia transvalensis]